VPHDHAINPIRAPGVISKTPVNYFSLVDIPRNPPNPERDAQIRDRQNVAGKFGFVLGCVAAIIAVSINLYRAPRPLTFLSLAISALLAALNMPVGIMLGLWGEKLTRPKHLRPK